METIEELKANSGIKTLNVISIILIVVSVLAFFIMCSVNAEKLIGIGFGLIFSSVFIFAFCRVINTIAKNLFEIRKLLEKEKSV